MSTDATASTSEAAADPASQAPGPAQPDDIVRVLAPDGHTVEGAEEPSLSEQERTDLYRALVRARAIDEAATKLAAERRIGFHSGALGEEATIVGSAFALGVDDWVFPCHREFGAALLRGMSAQQYADHLFGNADDIVKGRQMPDHLSHRAGRLASVSSPLGTQITHAVGYAWAAKLRGDELAVLVHFGDAAAESGDFHNGMNFAGVFKTPVVFLCRNSASARGERFVESVADKGIAYDVPAVRCDGNDPLAVVAVTRAALARAHRGEGATLIEAITHRLGPDARAAALDPLVRMRGHLRARLGWDEAADRELWAELWAEADGALARAAAKPAPAVRTMFEDVFAEIPARLDEQHRELAAAPRFPGRD